MKGVRYLKIKELRLAAELTQGQLAEIMGVAQSTVAGWEDGSYPPAKKLPALAKALGVSSINDLYKSESA